MPQKQIEGAADADPKPKTPPKKKATKAKAPKPTKKKAEKKEEPAAKAPPAADTEGKLIVTVEACKQ